MKSKNGVPTVAFLIWRNLKIEIIILLGSIILTIFNRVPIDILTLIFQSLSFDHIVEFSSISTGIYITVMTIIATSFISATPKILKSNLDKAITTVFVVGLIENMLVIIFSICHELLDGNVIFITFLGIFIASIITFIKLVIFVVLLFSCNMDNMATELDEQERHKEIIVNLLADIKLGIDKHNKK